MAILGERVTVGLFKPQCTSRRAKRKNDRFHLWDYDSDTRSHTLSLNPEQIIELVILNEHFDPAEFVTWSPNWFISRNWGTFS